MGALLWLASYPRSGNTWTRNFLHNLMQLIAGIDPESFGQEGQDINRMGRVTTWEISKIWYEPILGKAPKDATAQEQAAARLAAQSRIAASVEKLMLVKTHHALVQSCGYPTINLKETAGAVYILRNPLDVVLSFAKHFGLEIDHAIQVMNQASYQARASEHAAYEHYGAWRENVLSWTRKPHRAIYVMRYEDMLQEPMETFGKLARHLLLDASDDQLARAIELSSFERLKRQEESAGFMERPKHSRANFFRIGKADQWKEALTPAQIKALLEPNRDLMTRFGYLPEGF